MNRRLAALLAVLLVVAAGGTVTIVTTDDSAKTPAPTESPTATPTPLTAQAGSDLASDLRAETPIPAADAARNAAIGRKLGPVRQEAARFGPKCRVDYSKHLWSSREGTRPTELDLHFTVSFNRPGTGDIDAVHNYWGQTRKGSSHFLIDFEGNCLKLVPLREKAWTVGNANRYSLGIEVIAYGNETRAQWKAAPLFKDQILAKLARRVMDQYGLPLRWVDPEGCVFPPGWTDHNALECGNNHTDVKPNFPYGLFRRQLRSVR